MSAGTVRELLEQLRGMLKVNGDQVRIVDEARLRSMGSEHLARQCHRLVLAQSARRHYLKTLSLGEHRPAVRFNRGPLLSEGPNGTMVEHGEVLHPWIPDSE